MSLDHFRTVGEQDITTTGLESSESEVDHPQDCRHYTYLECGWECIDEKYYGEDTPNHPPIMPVSEKVAIGLEPIDDNEVVQEVAKWWDESRADEYVEVIRITFNDLSTWHIPLKPWDEDYARTREHIVRTYLPEVVKWKALVRGKDVQEVLEKWDKPWEESKPEWFEDVSDTGMSETTRKWINKNLSAVPHIDRKVESDGDEVELDVEDDDWEDDW